MHNSICHDWVTSGNISSQPDITIAVGNAQQAVRFMAHKFVLSSYSGYFKTLFATYDGVEAYISNIGSHTFAYLLSFMYTGHLELNPLNVYEIFAASSWLRMIEVLDLCQQYFIQKHHYTTALLQSSVVKPIPRRHVALVSLHNQEPNRVLTYQPLRLHDESSSIFKPVRIEASHQSQSPAIEECDSEEVDIIEGEDRNSSDQNRPATSTTSDNLKAPSPSDKVVLDIACCDGPIKFHRVTNQFYNPEKAMTTSAKDDDSASTCHKCNQTFSNELRQRFGLSGCQFSNAGSTNRQPGPSIPDSSADTKKKVENLQCYSCKTCGSKFPSYYFVHKHRKLHHQDTKEFLE